MAGWSFSLKNLKNALLHIWMGGVPWEQSSPVSKAFSSAAWAPSVLARSAGCFGAAHPAHPGPAGLWRGQSSWPTATFVSLYTVFNKKKKSQKLCFPSCPESMMDPAMLGHLSHVVPVSWRILRWDTGWPGQPWALPCPLDYTALHPPL